MKKFNVCIVGGGSTFTLGFLKSFVRMKEEFPLNKLVLFDIDKDRQEPIGKFGEILFKERFPELDFAYTTDIMNGFNHIYTRTKSICHTTGTTCFLSNQSHA